MRTQRRLYLLRSLCCALALTSAWFWARPAPASDPTVEALPDDVAALAGTWTGTIGPSDARLPIVVRFENQGGKLLGYVRAPAWGDVEWGLADVEANPVDLGLDARSFAVSFSVESSEKHAGQFRGVLIGAHLDGTYSWNGVEHKFSARRPEPGGKKTAGPTRPEPPYQVECVAFESKGARIAARLSVPPGAGRHPAVIIANGSGPSSCITDVPGGLEPRLHQWTISDAITRSGIAVLLLSDRGTGGSTGNYQGGTLADLAGDLRAAVNYLASRGDIAADKIGVAGISLGGIVAIESAVLPRTRGGPQANLSFLVLINTPGVDGLRARLDQFKRFQGLSRVDEGEITDAQVRAEAGDDDREKLRRAREALVARSRERLKRDEGSFELMRTLYEINCSELDRDAVLRRMAEAVVAAGNQGTILFGDSFPAWSERATSPLWRSVNRYDPRPSLGRVQVPVLVLAGELDPYVSAEDNVGEIECALRCGGNADVSVKILPGLGHGLNKVNAQKPTRPISDDPVDRAALKLISDWITSRVGAPNP